jgi:eukaryotic-like serine/threonine-protein kinase
LPTNPYVGKLPRDSMTHAIKAEAPGYVARQRDVTFDRDRNIEIVLEHQAVDTPPTPTEVPGEFRPRPHSTSSQQQPPGDDMKTGGTKKPNRNIDQTNPYAQPQ